MPVPEVDVVRRFYRFADASNEFAQLGRRNLAGATWLKRSRQGRRAGAASELGFSTLQTGIMPSASQRAAGKR